MKISNYSLSLFALFMCLAICSAEEEIEDTAGAEDSENVKVRWFDYYVDPPAVTEEDLSSSVGIGQSVITEFFVENGVGYVYAMDGDDFGGGEWVLADSFAFPDGIFQAYTRITYCVDYVKEDWDLYVNDQIVLAGLGFFVDNSKQLDHMDASEVEALGFGHADGRLTPNVTSQMNQSGYGGFLNWEGGSDLLSTAEVLRGALLADVFESNRPLLDYALGMRGGATPLRPDSYIFVDSIKGDDHKYSGRLSGVGKGQGRMAAGPKSSITAAMNAAADYDVIIVESGIYDESILNQNGKNLVLVINGSVTIR